MFLPSNSTDLWSQTAPESFLCLPLSDNNWVLCRPECKHLVEIGRGRRCRVDKCCVVFARRRWFRFPRKTRAMNRLLSEIRCSCMRVYFVLFYKATSPAQGMISALKLSYRDQLLYEWLNLTESKFRENRFICPRLLMKLCSEIWVLQEVQLYDFPIQDLPTNESKSAQLLVWRARSSRDSHHRLLQKTLSQNYSLIPKLWEANRVDFLFWMMKNLLGQVSVAAKPLLSQLVLRFKARWLDL